MKPPRVWLDIDWSFFVQGYSHQIEEDHYWKYGPGWESLAANQKDLQTYRVLDENLPLEGFWKSLPLNFSEIASVYVGDAQPCIDDLEHKVRLIHIDRDTDLSPKQRSCWLHDALLSFKAKVLDATLVFPKREGWAAIDTDPPPLVLYNGRVRAETWHPAVFKEFDGMKVQTLTISRNPAACPPWLDGAFNDFIDLGVKTVGIPLPHIEPRPFNQAIVTRLYAIYAKKMGVEPGEPYS